MNRRTCLLFFLLLAPALAASPVEAQLPVIFRVSEGVRPNAIVSLYGEYLTGTPKVRFLSADGSVAATQPAVQTDAGGHTSTAVGWPNSAACLVALSSEIATSPRIGSAPGGVAS